MLMVIAADRGIATNFAGHWHRTSWKETA